jgi:hypothetical protein
MGPSIEIQTFEKKMQRPSAGPRRAGQLAAAPRRAAREPVARALRFRSFGTPGLTTAMAADATAKARLERLLGELDKSAETPAGEDVDGGDYPHQRVLEHERRD